MLKIECESCKAPYQIDERRVGPQGLKMRCPRCGHSFVVKAPGQAVPPPTATAAGVGVTPAAAPAKNTRTVPGVAPDAPARPHAPPVLKRTAAGMVSAPRPHDDLPSPVDELGLPAPAAARPVAQRTAAGIGQSPAASFEIDLPAVGAAAPARREPMEMDLPAAMRAQPTGTMMGHGGRRMDADLPAVAGADLPSVAGGAGLPALSGFGADLPAFAGAGLPAVSRGGADLPARAGAGVGLPAVAGGRGDPFGGGLGLPVAAHGGGMDLPVVSGVGLPSVGGVGLPSVSGVGLPSASAGLPAVAAGLPSPAAALPQVAAGLPQMAAAVPAVAAGLPGTRGGFGEIDLPLMGFDAGGGGRQVAVREAPQQVRRPSGQMASPFGDFGELDLPTELPGGGPQATAATMPGMGRSPSVAGFGTPASLPGFPAPQLPPPGGGGMPPARESLGGFASPQMPPARESIPGFAAPQMPPQRESLPGFAAPQMPGAGGGFDLGGPAMGFGELDLPPVGMAPAPPQPEGSFAGQLPTGNSFSGALPTGNSFSGALPTGNSFAGQLPGPAGGMGFGELDLGGGGGDGLGLTNVSVAGPPPQEQNPQAFLRTEIGRKASEALGSLGDGGEASLGGDGSVGGEEALGEEPGGEAAFDEAPAGAAAEVRKREEAEAPAPAAPKVAGAAKKVALAFGVATVLIGGSLQLTELGAFGHLAISDAIHAQEYVRVSAAAIARARESFAHDDLPDARAAIDDLAKEHKRYPRARQLGAYAAFASFFTDVRFGKDPSRPSGHDFIKEIPQGAETSLPSLSAARAGELAAKGDGDKAKSGLSVALRRADPALRHEILLLRGELELQSKDATAAIATFQEAKTVSDSFRANYALARAYALAGTLDAALKAADAALAIDKTHVAAQAVRADILFRSTREHVATLKTMDSVLSGPNRARLAPAELADAFAARGWMHYHRGAMSDARQSFEEAVKIDSRHIRALWGQGEVFYHEGRYTEALARYESASGVDPSAVKPLVGVAKSRIALERLADAKNQLTEARTAFPKSADVLYWLGMVENALGNKSVAEQMMREAVTLVDPTDWDAVLPYVGLAKLLTTQGHAPEAAAILIDAQKKLPDSPLLRRALGDVESDQGRFDSAVEQFRKALEKEPSDLATRFRLGVTMRRMRKFEEAAKEFDRISEQDKEYPGLALERGVLYEESGDVKGALEMFESALKKAPDDPDLQLRVGSALVAVKKPNDALVYLKKVIQLRPTSAEAHHYMGRAYFDKGAGFEPDAMRELKRALELDTNRAEYHLYVGWAANERGELGLAKDEIDKALALDRGLADGYWQRGTILRKQSAVDDAFRDIRHAIELRPDRLYYRASLAEVYEDKNLFDVAMTEWSRVAVQEDAKPYWKYRYGKHLVEKGRASEAYTQLYGALTGIEATSEHPGWLADGYFLGASTAEKVGKRAEAADWVAKFLQVSGPSHPDRKDGDKMKARLAPKDR